MGIATQQLEVFWSFHVTDIGTKLWPDGKIQWLYFYFALFGIDSDKYEIF